MPSFLVWILLGLIAGAIAKLIYPGTQGGGILATIILGILGSLLGGWIGSTFLGTGAVGASLSLPSIALAVLGAIVLIFLWGLLFRRAL